MATRRLLVARIPLDGGVDSAASASELTSRRHPLYVGLERNSRLMRSCIAYGGATCLRLSCL
eukprot:scaffold8025_cov44-Cylindrotheca_fusiformis.AAC.2